MVEMTPLQQYIAGPQQDGRRYFTMSYQALNWNDTEWKISDAAANPIFGSAYSTVFIEGINIAVSAATAGVKFPYIVLQMAGHIMRRLDHWTTTDIYDNHTTWVRMGIPKDRMQSEYAPVPQWFWARFIADYAATDDGHMKIWGWVDSEPQPAFRQPVSVQEMAVWPWRRV